MHLTYVTGRTGTAGISCFSSASCTSVGDGERGLQVGPYIQLNYENGHVLLSFDSNVTTRQLAKLDQESEFLSRSDTPVAVSRPLIVPC